MLNKIIILIFVLAFSVAFAANDNKVKIDSLSVTEITENAENLIEKEVSIIGTVDHVCKHGGKKLFIFDENNPQKRFKIIAGKEIGAFKMELEGSEILVKGVIKETRVDEAFLDNWEAKVMAKKTEVAHEGHNHSNGKEEEHNEQNEVENALKKIKSFRDKIAKSEKGYLSFFDMECNSFIEIK